MPNKINNEYEVKHLARIRADQERIRIAYEKSIQQIYTKAVGLNLKGKSFQISDYPALSGEINKALSTFSKAVEFTLQNGVKDQWEMSTTKNAKMIHKQYGEKNISETVNRMIYDPQSDALKQFQKRVTNGFTLSDRVLKYTGQFQSQIEHNLFAGISEGKSAVAMARDQVAYMENPEPLFRRVKHIKKNGEAVLKLSKNAQKYYDDLGAPGQGVYRSPYKNFMRITRDTINDSYRQSDMVRYQTLPFVLGYDVNLSNRHPRTDICDDLKGTYPKTFIWRKWHIQCLCNCAAKLASPEEYARYEQAILSGTEGNFKFKDQVTELPSQLNSYVIRNQGKMDNWKVKPDWVTENRIRI
jgi:hypothetical protein